MRLLAWHRWLGRVLMLYLSVVFASGALLVYGHELDAAFWPQMQRPEGATGAAGLGALYDAARAALPEARVVRVLDPAGGPLAAAAEIDRGGERVALWLDPDTAAVQGETSGQGPRSLLLGLHASLMLKNAKAELVAGLIILPLALQIVFGLFSERRILRWMLRSPWPRRDPPRLRWGSLHRWSGLWATPVMIVTTLTGVVFMAGTLRLLPGPPPRPAPVERAAPLPQGFDGATLDRAAAAAAAALPGFVPREVRLPGGQRDPLLIIGDVAEGGTGDVVLDPADLSVLATGRSADRSPLRRLLGLNGPLHEGSFGGTASRIVWFLSGLLAAAVALSGFLVTSFRLGRAGRASPRAAIRAIFLPARIATILALAGMLALVLWTMAG